MGPVADEAAAHSYKPIRSRRAAMQVTERGILEASTAAVNLHETKR